MSVLVDKVTFQKIRDEPEAGQVAQIDKKKKQSLSRGFLCLIFAAPFLKADIFERRSERAKCCDAPKCEP